MDVGHCTHIDALFADGTQKRAILDKYAAVARWSVHRLQPGTPPAKRRRIAPPACGACGLALARPFACLQPGCAFVGCWAGAHAAEHAKDEDHALAADARTGALFCVECDDVVFEASFAAAWAQAVGAAEERETRFHSAKKLREPYRAWAPNDTERKALDELPVIPCQGRLPLLNLGQTCYLNAVVQALLHNPLLRAYFLSDRHNAGLCRNKDCACCALDALFVAAHAPTPAPYAPVALLTLLWRAPGSALAATGAGQADAHEALLALRGALHASARGSTQSACNCAAHDAFGGVLASAVVCGKCGTESVVGDAVMDLSLGLEEGEGTLEGCLRRFVAPEKLPAKDYTCAKCKGPQEATKALSIRKLSPVLSFHLKRFSHKDPKSHPKKLSARVRFPGALDMAPYTTHARAAAAAPGPPGLYAYELFAVVCHEGALDTGHYYAFARAQDAWYKFDDDKVTPSSLHAAQAGPAYMLFYAQRTLAFRAGNVPTYVLAREGEKAREAVAVPGKDVKAKDGAKEKEKDGKDSKERRKEEERERERARREREREERKKKEVEDALLETVL